MSRARMPLTLNPRKNGFTRIPPTLADTASRDLDLQVTPQEQPPHSFCIAPHSARTGAFFWREAPPFSPRSQSHRESTSPSLSSVMWVNSALRACSSFGLSRQTLHAQPSYAQPSVLWRAHGLWRVRGLCMETPLLGCVNTYMIKYISHWL